MRKIRATKLNLMSKIILLTIVSFIALTASSQKVDVQFGKGANMIASDSSFSMNLSFRIQSLFVNEFDVVNDDLGRIDNHTSNFLIRRARIKLNGFAYSPRLKYKAELALSNRDLAVVNSLTRNTPGLVLDAVLKYEVKKNLWFWFGQTKLPGNRERIVSSANLQFVDRSQLNSRFNADRDLGFQLHYKVNLAKQVLKPIVSFTQGREET